MTALPLTPRKLSTVPTVQNNLSVLDFVAQQGHIVHQLRPPSLSPMGHTQDRLLSDAATDLRVRPRSESLSTLPATPPSPSVSRRQRNLTESPVLQQRHPSLPAALVQQEEEHCIQHSQDDGDGRSVHQEGEMLSKRCARDHAATQIIRCKTKSTPTKPRMTMKDKDTLKTANRAVRRKSTDSTQRAKPTLAEAEAEIEIAERLHLRKSRRRQKALIVQDRSRPVSARLRSEAKGRHKGKKATGHCNKENEIDATPTMAAAVIKDAARESTKLKDVVLAMEAYKPVALLGSGRLTTGGHILRHGLFSKGAASAPVKVKGKPVFCEAQFLQTEQHKPGTETEDSAAERGDIVSGPEPRSWRKQSSATRRTTRCEESPQKRHCKTAEVGSKGKGQVEGASDSQESDSSLPLQRQIKKATKRQEPGHHLTAHYGRRRKRTLLPLTPHAKLMSSPRKEEQEETPGLESDGDDQGEASDEDGLSAYSKQMRAKRRHSDKQRREAIDIDTKRQSRYRLKHLTPAGHVPAKGSGDEVRLSDTHQLEAEVHSKPSTSRRRLTESKVFKQLARKVSHLPQDDDESEDSIYLKVRVSTAPPRRRKLTGQALNEEGLEEAVLRMDAPEQTNSRVEIMSKGNSGNATRHCQNPVASAHHVIAKEQSESSVVSAWKGSAWTGRQRTSSARELEALAPSVHKVKDTLEEQDATRCSMGQSAPDETLQRVSSGVQAVQREVRRPIMSSRLDAGDLANGWRLQHTLAHDESAEVTSAGNFRRANTFAGLSVEQATTCFKPHEEPQEDERPAQATGLRHAMLPLQPRDRSDTQHELRMTSSTSPSRYANFLSSQGLAPLHLHDTSSSPQKLGMPSSENITEEVPWPLSSDRMGEAINLCRPPEVLEGDQQDLRLRPQEDGPGNEDYRPQTAAAASTIYAGRSVWQGIKARIEAVASGSACHSFSSDEQMQETRRSLDHCFAAVGGSDFEPVPPPNDDFLENHCERIMSGPVTEIGSDAYSEETAAWRCESAAGVQLYPNAARDDRGSPQQQSSALATTSEAQSRQYTRHGVTGAPAATYFSPLSGAIDPSEEHQDSTSIPLTRVQQLQLPPAGGSRTNSHSSYGNSSFDDLDFLSVRPGPGKARVGNEGQRVVSDPRRTFGQPALLYGVVGEGVAGAGAGAASSRSTNFWSRQHASHVRLDVSSLFHDENQQPQRGTGAVPRLPEREGSGGAGPVNLSEQSATTSASQAASSSLDPLDMEWSG